MRTYEITWTKQATKALRRLERRDAQRIHTAVDALAADPRPAGARMLKGPLAGSWRLRVTEHLRILYTVDDKIRVVSIINVGQREGIY